MDRDAEAEPQLSGKPIPDDVPFSDSLEGLTANFTRSGTALARAGDGEIKVVSGSMASELRG